MTIQKVYRTELTRDAYEDERTYEDLRRVFDSVWQTLESGESANIDTEATRLQLDGDTMTGSLILDGDPSEDLGAATKQYVDAVPVGWVPISTQTASSAPANIDFTTGIDSTYDTYKIIGSGLVPNADAALRIQHFTAGTRYTTAAYQWSFDRIGPGSNSNGSASNTDYNELIDDVGKELNEGCDFELTIHNPTNTNFWNKLTWHGTRVNSGGNTYTSVGGGRDSDISNPLTGIRFYFAGTVFVSGTFTLYGISKP